ncbi:MAG: hypothetical protein IKB88_03475 [Clostridia bacterium]|nr:hypothetical protein [Clostridia bacterium]
MKKRAITALVMLNVFFALIVLRLADLSVRTQTAANFSSGIRLDITELRGTIYDCNMNPLTNGETAYRAIAKPTLKALAALESELDAVAFSSVKQAFSSGDPAMVSVSNRNFQGADIEVVEYPVRYDSLACHIIGYTDYDGRGVSGIEKAFDTLLSGAKKTVYARVAADAHGKVLVGEKIEVFNNNFPMSGVILAVDRNVQRIAETALDNSVCRCAAVVVMDVGTGAVRACVSRPDYDRNNIASVLNDADSPLINRAFQPYSVGSVFKPVVAAAALENGIGEDYTHNCTGSVTLNGVTFNCHKKDGHGELDMESAVAVSCNTYFISLAIEVGADEIIETAKRFGFGEQTVFAESMKSRSGNLPEKVDSMAATANLSFGQGELTATPVQICTMMSVIANGGLSVKPYLVEGQVDENGNAVRKGGYSEQKQIISPSTAEILKRMLVAVVKEGSGVRAASEFVGCAGKTATAQTGRMSGEAEIYNAWFAGFFPSDNPRYAVVVLRENGGEGAVSCAPVFREIAEGITLSEGLISTQ